jgi:hypothetical protein
MQIAQAESVQPRVEMIEKLLFVFSANGGRWNAIADSVKKLLMMEGCALCSITHGITGEKPEFLIWKRSVGVPIEYVHRDEMQAKLVDTVGTAVPAVVAVTDHRLVLLLSPDAVARCRGSIPDLVGRLTLHAATKGLSFPTVSIVQRIEMGGSLRSAFESAREGSGGPRTTQPDLRDSV